MMLVFQGYDSIRSSTIGGKPRTYWYPFFSIGTVDPQGLGLGTAWFRQVGISLKCGVHYPSFRIWKKCKQQSFPFTVKLTKRFKRKEFIQSVTASFYNHSPLELCAVIAEAKA